MNLNTKVTDSNWITIKDKEGGIFVVRKEAILNIMQFPCQSENCHIKIHYQVIVPLPQGGWLEISKEEYIRLTNLLRLDVEMLPEPEGEVSVQ